MAITRSTTSSITRRTALATLGTAAGAAAAGCLSARDAFAAEAPSGEYIGIADGRGGAIVVKVTLDSGKIEAVEVVAENETPNVGTVPLEDYPAQIVENQSVNIESVAGATLSSAAMLLAVENALKGAGLNPEDFSKKIKVNQPAFGTEADVAVIGSGGAGLSAAVRAAQAGASVVVLEKTGVVGGTSNFSIEGFGSVGDKTHVALGCPMDAAALAAKYTEAYPDGRTEAFQVFADNVGAQVDWLRSIGCEMTVAASQNSVATSRECGPIGLSVVAALRAEAEKLGVEIRTNNSVFGILEDKGSLVGVGIDTPTGKYQLSCKAIVIAAGGYAANQDMRAQYNPPYSNLEPSCCCGCTGDGIQMAEEMGAALENMDYVRVNFTYTTSPTGLYYMGSLFNTGAIFVNDAGERFVNDQGGYGAGPTVFDLNGGTGWAIFDDSIAKPAGDVRAYGKLGLYTDADTIEELAEKCGIDPAGLAATVETYKGYVAEGADPEFGRAMLNMTFDEPPFHACKMTCKAQGTFGGIVCNTSCEVLDADGNAIPGLFAAGENASIGTYGANPAAVNVVFGSIAGASAAAYAAK